jgi:MYXO-CTERM domain-containing protein
MRCRWLVFPIALLTGCAASTEPEPVGAVGEGIQGGYDDAKDVAVVDIVWDMGGGQYSECSGSLLAPNMVLTAHHCVSQILNGAQGVDCTITSFSAPDKPTNFFVSTKQFLSMNAADYHNVNEILVPSGSTKICGWDQAILILSDNVAPTEAVPLVPRVDVHLAGKEAYSAVGFGGTVDTGANAGQRRRLDNLIVDCVGMDCPASDSYYIERGHEWIGDHGTCEGDSGGPALDSLGRVVGVTSRGGAGCTSPVYGDVFAWGDWIKQTATHAAQVGGYPAPAWVNGYPTDPAYSYPVGGACGDTCQSGYCLGDSGGQYCTRACEDAAPCPNGYSCVAVQGAQICQREAPPPDTNKSGGCSVQRADPTKPVPWFFGVGLAMLALARRRRR